MRTLRSVDQSIGDDRLRLSNATISVHEDRRFVFVVGFFHRIRPVWRGGLAAGLRGQGYVRGKGDLIRLVGE